VGGYWCGHAAEALVPAVGHLFFKIGHDDCLVLTEVASEVWEAGEPDECFEVLIVESLIQGLVGRVLDASII